MSSDASPSRFQIARSLLVGDIDASTYSRLINENGHASPSFTPLVHQSDQLSETATRRILLARRRWPNITGTAPASIENTTELTQTRRPLGEMFAENSNESPISTPRPVQQTSPLVSIATRVGTSNPFILQRKLIAADVSAATESFISTLRKENEQSSTRKASRSCSVCLTDSPLRRAVFIVCGHSICLACAVQMQADAENQMITCPLCRAETAFVPLIESFDEE